MERNFAGPPIIKDSPRRKNKLCKSTGPDSVSVELLEALELYGICKIANY